MGAERGQPGLGDVYSTVRSLRDPAHRHTRSNSYLQSHGAVVSGAGRMDRISALPLLKLVILGCADGWICVRIFALHAGAPAGTFDGTDDVSGAIDGTGDTAAAERGNQRAQVRDHVDYIDSRTVPVLAGGGGYIDSIRRYGASDRNVDRAGMARTPAMRYRQK